MIDIETFVKQIKTFLETYRIATSDFECETRVVMRIMNGRLNFSESSKASLTNSNESCESAGSSMPTRPNLAKIRESCSFCDECIAGSSAPTNTNPALIPACALVMNGSIATFNPTCFIAASDRCPPIAAPNAASNAVFSFGDH